MLPRGADAEPRDYSSEAGHPAVEGVRHRGPALAGGVESRLAGTDTILLLYIYVSLSRKVDSPHLFLEHTKIY